MKKYSITTPVPASLAEHLCRQHGCHLHFPTRRTGFSDSAGNAWCGKFRDMKNSANTILHQALELSANERSEIVEELLASLDEADSTVIALWAREADDRIEAFERGELESKPAEAVFGKYRQR